MQVICCASSLQLQLHMRSTSKHFDPALQAHARRSGCAPALVSAHAARPHALSEPASSCIKRQEASKGRDHCYASELLCCGAALIAAGGCKTASTGVCVSDNGAPLPAVSALLWPSWLHPFLRSWSRDAPHTTPQAHTTSQARCPTARAANLTQCGSGQPCSIQKTHTQLYLKLFRSTCATSIEVGLTLT